MSHTEHRAQAPKNVRCFVLTISDTRTEATDQGGRIIGDLLIQDGHQIAGRAIVRDDPDQVRAVISEQLEQPDVQVIVTTGGTGVGVRDSTFEALEPLLDKRLDGFGELFRMLSYQEIGAAAMLSRACAGVANGKIILSLPGSEHAVRLAMTKLVLPELGHLVREVTK